MWYIYRVLYGSAWLWIFFGPDWTEGIKFGPDRTRHRHTSLYSYLRKVYSYMYMGCIKARAVSPVCFRELKYFAPET